MQLFQSVQSHKTYPVIINMFWQVRIVAPCRLGLGSSLLEDVNSATREVYGPVAAAWPRRDP